MVGLRERATCRGGFSNVKVGQIVLMSENIPRTGWKLGIIEELLPSLDEQTRSVKLKTSSGCLLRPISKLVPLELECEVPRLEIGSNTSSRPVRTAAKEALDKIRNLYV